MVNLKHFLILLLLIIPIFAVNTYGYSRVKIERSWTLNNIAGNEIDFRGALVVNDTNQNVLMVFTEPTVDLMQDENGTIWVIYKGSSIYNSMNITASAIVDIIYNTEIYSDSTVPKDHPSSFTDLTTPSHEMIVESERLAIDESSLNTAANLVNRVHESVEYDLSYWGKVYPAQDVFKERKGVCVEYSHLFLSMARSLGFETRYVSGYVFADSWQPHAWTEIYIPNYGWLSADPIFGQLGIIDNSHVAIQHGDDQNSIYDLLVSQNTNATLYGENDLTLEFSSEEPEPAGITLAFDNVTYAINITLTNTRPQYVFGSYDFIPPRGYGQRESYILLLEPYEVKTIEHHLDASLFEPGFAYKLPISSSFNDARIYEVLEVVIPNKEETYSKLDIDDKNLLCCYPQAIFCILLSSVFVIRRVQQ